MTDEECERILQQVAKKMTDDMMSALYGSGAFKSPRPTAVRLTPSGAIEVVELQDDGSIIEPPKPCPKCGPVLLCAEHMAHVT
jgi:ribosomal protein S27AE